MTIIRALIIAINLACVVYTSVTKPLRFLFSVHQCLDSCGVNSICTGALTSFARPNCTCLPGYASIYNNNSFCYAITTCAVSNGGCQDICADTIDGVVCSCFKGYSLSNDLRSCSPVNGCLTNNGGCDQSCTYSSPGVVNCTCSAGFTAYESHCIVIDACTAIPFNAGCTQSCTATIDGSYYCSCTSGFYLAPDNHTCNAINNCVHNNGGCGANSTCISLTAGSNACQCDLGFASPFGNGSYCHNIAASTTSSRSSTTTSHSTMTVIHSNTASTSNVAAGVGGAIGGAAVLVILVIVLRRKRYRSSSISNDQSLVTVNLPKSKSKLSRYYK